MTILLPMSARHWRKPDLIEMAKGISVISVANLPERIVLIDGDELTSLMVQHGVGVRMEQRFELMKADEDYYIED